MGWKIRSGSGDRDVTCERVTIVSMPHTSPHHGIRTPGLLWPDPVLWIYYVQGFWQRHDCLDRCTEIQQLIVESMLVRRDVGAAVQALWDWRVLEQRLTRVSKFEPGDHYYVLDTKFDSYELSVLRMTQCVISSRRSACVRVTFMTTRAKRKMTPIDHDCGHLITRAAFEESVRTGMFIDYDGFGEYATATEVSDVVVKPSRLGERGFVWPPWATHVLWYNR